MNKPEQLFELAQKASQNAYAPYSKFKVGAAILTTTGRFYAGCNVENISYPNGTCAESGAISAMIAGADTQIAAILIYADSKFLITPCGACRQRIAEFSAPNTVIYLSNKEGIQQEHTVAELLPESFKEF